jgi:hypothetical protein
MADWNRDLPFDTEPAPALAACGSGLVFCVCDACCLATAAEHAYGDMECGREWVCACAACNKARVIMPTLEIDVRFTRLERLQNHLSAVRGVAEMED